MASPRYNVGDVLRIREWDDMLNEFGTRPGRDSINCKGYFTTNMKPLCGETFTVKLVEFSPLAGCYKYFSEECVECTHTSLRDCWFISEDMLEPYFEKDMVIDSEEEKNINDFLSNFVQPHITRWSRG